MSRRLLLIALLSAGTAGAAGPAGAAPPAFELGRTSVTPRPALFDGTVPIVLRYRFRAAEPLDLRVRVVRLPGGRPVRAWTVPGAEPGEGLEVRWDGVNRRGGIAREGRFAFRIGPVGGRERRGRRFVLRGHVFPVAAPHWDRGAIGQFGAPRSGGRVHEGYDAMAACGARLVAARGGRVERWGYDDVLYGNYVQIDGLGTAQDYFYAHLIAPARVRRGRHVRTGQMVGKVGQTGNARTTPCHLHFEIRTPRGPIDPVPPLFRWDAWS